MAKHGSVRTNLEYWLARIILGVFSLLPLSLAIRVGSGIGLLGLLIPKLRRTGRRNLALAFPELSAQAREKLLRGCFQNLGRLLGVFSHFREKRTEVLRETIQCEGIERFEAAVRAKRGVIYS